MDRFDPFVKYADVYGDIINWEKDPMNKPQNQNKYFFSDGKTYYEQICKMLRLMSVFKEAFNQIYSNEDEISEAWENFVNNLSASVVEGSEPDVTLTWTDDSVNFEFTMVPGVPGEQGVGIASISFNSDYTMTITLSDGNSYTSMSLKGETGPQGPQGETGSGLQILDVYATLADLQSAHPTGQPGDAYQVGSAENYILYIWSYSQSAWVQAGTLGTVSPYTSSPLMDGTASAGSQNLYARGDHVHPSDTSRASKEELDALIKTSQALIDQSFTYRESPAIQDGLARIDKIKGNTLVWNQLYSPAVLSGDTSGVTRTQTADGLLTLNGTANATGVQVLSNVDFPAISGHKYLVKTSKALGYQCLQLFNVDDNSSAQAFGNQNTIYSATASFTARIRLIVLANQTYSNISCYINIFDLTKMGLDSITDPSEFSSLFPLSYYDYNVGSLLSFNGTGLKTIGFNQWDEEWEVGGIGATGVPEAGNYVRSKNYIPVMANTEYCFTSPLWGVIYQYDINHNFLLRTPLIGGGSPLFTTLANTAYIKFFMQAGYGTDYKNDICLNISGNKNGSYAPYKESSSTLPTLTYFPAGMKSARNAYDELTPAKAITRIGVVDLGTLDYVYDYSVPRFYTSNLSSIIKKPATSDDMGEILCGSYETLTVNQFFAQARNMTAMLTITGNISFINTDYTSPATFKSAMSGVMLYYEMATPAEASISPELDLSFMAYEDGTEQLLPVNGSVPATSPIIADMTYLSIDDAMEYIIDKLANVPQNTQQILDALEDDVADLQTDVGALQPAVSALQTSVGNINTNIGQLSSTVAGHTSSISGMQSDISDLNTGLSDIEDTVTDNTSRIGTLETDLASTDGQVQSLGSSVSTLSSTVSDQGTELGEIDSIIQDISNNAVLSSLGQHELGFVAAYVDATLPANTGTSVTIPKPTIFPNNYTPLFIVGMSTGSYNVSICSLPHTFGNADSVTCRVWNHGGQQTTQISVYILCMRQRQSQ